MFECSVAGCERATFARGWCAAHYYRVRNTGDLRAEVPIGATTVRKCDECEAVFESRNPRGRFCSDRCRYRERDRRRWPGAREQDGCCVVCERVFRYVQVRRPRLYCDDCGALVYGKSYRRAA